MALCNDYVIKVNQQIHQQKMNLPLILEKLLPNFFANAFNTSKLQASTAMKHETVTKNKLTSSEETKLFLRTDTSLRYEYQLYDFVRHRLAAMKKKFHVD